MAKILIVDDSIVARAKLKHIIINAGHEIIGEAEDGYEAFKLYRELSPDIVTMDIIMPFLDGIGALKLIKEYDENAKIIMLTVLGQGNRILEALNSGAVNYINKPFNEIKVLEAINDALN
ncbi:response regulator [Clostridium grantii]|uniref:Stage 0 sporulation protein A homolog n=1 Tax=Clostridium grantii DSM 8605 TaxID=1121316 RepID=A0A1M5VT68_9CLOT|nr:response regulator [Clostridium grantii]SHH78446.1 two-component system, chemotaxis family, response regulator CheY [Clostridium grantii DSM 8605]